ncbi:MAG: amino acid permease, partial [Acidobacteria bacterium]|nr:amino acid permease [Acidobacteriota bacterium]
MNPKSGGLYVYIRDCFGSLPAFLFGWTLFFAIGSGAVGTLAVAFSDNLSAIVPMSPLVQKILSLAMVAVVALVNVRGTRQSADLQNVTTAIKAGAVIITSVILLWLGSRLSLSLEGFWPRSFDRSLLSGAGLAMIAVLWAYEGWQYATYSAGETVDARRVYPRAFLTGTLFLIALYLLANVAYLAALGPAEVMTSK